MGAKYTVHDQAASTFDDKAAWSRNRVGSVSPSSPSGQPEWTPDIHVTDVSEKDVHALRIRDDYPVPAIYEKRNRSYVGLVGEPAAEFLRVAEGLWRAIKPKGAVSAKRVVDLSCDWLFDEGAVDSLTRYVLNAVSAEAAQTRVWVPIRGLCVEAPFQVGKVTFEPLTADRIKVWHKTEGYAQLDAAGREAADRYFADLAKEHRGYAVGWTELVADQEQARILCLERIEASLGMLRFFSGGAIVPFVRSLCTPSGRERNESYRVFFERENKFAGESRGLLDGETARTWRVGQPDIEKFMSVGLATLSDLLNADELNGFQQRVLSSVRLFSDAALEHRLQVKLVLVLSALESVYLGSGSEPIQQNVGDRLAFMTETTADARVALAALVRDIYKARSRFVHHGKDIESSDELASFFRSAWLGVVRAIERVGHYSTVGEFTTAIDRRKFS